MLSPKSLKSSYRTAPPNNNLSVASQSKLAYTPTLFLLSFKAFPGCKPGNDCASLPAYDADSPASAENFSSLSSAPKPKDMSPKFLEISKLVKRLLNLYAPTSKEVGLFAPRSVFILLFTS